MKVKQAVKKMSAVAGGALLMGLTIGGAMAYDLSDYPYPFVQDGEFNARIVVGAAAATSDVIGAVDIAAGLQAAAKIPIDVGTGVVSVTGGLVEDIRIAGDNELKDAFRDVIDHTDVPFLEEGTVTVDMNEKSRDYRYHEEIRFVANSTAVGTAVTTGLAFVGNDDFEDNVFITVGRDTIGYYWVLDEDLEADHEISEATTADPFEMHFLGRDIRITSATATSITAEVANEYYMATGDTVTVEGRSVNLINVGSNGAVVVEVDGTRGTVSGTGSTRIGGLRIQVRDYFYSDQLDERSANLLVGETTTETFNNGDEYIGEDRYRPQWVWHLEDLNTSTPTVGVLFRAELDRESGEEYRDYDSVIYQEESIVFPGDFARITFDSLNQNQWARYTFDREQRDLFPDTASGSTPTVTSAHVISIRSDRTNTGLLVGTQRTDRVYLYPTSNTSEVDVYFRDPSTRRAVYGDTIIDGEELFSVEHGRTRKPLLLSEGASDYHNVTWTLGSEVISVAFTHDGSAGASFLGLHDTDSAAKGLWYNGGPIDGMETNLMTLHGVRIVNPDSEFQRSRGRLILDVPTDVDDFRANVVVSGQGTQRTQVDSGAYQVVPLPAGQIAVLDTNAQLGAEPLIVVGGPYANSIAAQLLGQPSPEEIEDMFEQGRAKIRLFEDQNALLVAGWSAQDTQGASIVLANYEDYAGQLVGTEVEIVTTNLQNLQVSTVN